MIYRSVFLAPVILWMLALIPVKSEGQHVLQTEVHVSVESILDSLTHQFGKIEDYTVNARISIRMPRFRMPRKTVKLYFKRPNKVKVEAEGFAVVPRTGLGTSPLGLLGNLVESRVVGMDTLGGRPQWLVEGTVNPDSLKFRELHERAEPGSQLFMRVWVDADNWVVSQAETYTDTLRILSIRNSFEEFEGRIFLPRSTELNFYLSTGFLARLGDREPMGGAFAERGEMDLEETGEELTGVVRIEFSRYKINRGLKDKIFRDRTF